MKRAFEIIKDIVLFIPAMIVLLVVVVISLFERDEDTDPYEIH